MKYRGGNLPLHLACQTGCTHSVLQALVEAWPDSILVRNEHGDLPIDLILHKIDIPLERWDRERIVTSPSQPLLHFVCSHSRNVRIVTRLIQRLATQRSIASTDSTLTVTTAIAPLNTTSDERQLHPMLVFEPFQEHDQHGSLPLHCAVGRHDISRSVIQSLIDQCTQSIRIQNTITGDLPLHCVCRYSYASTSSTKRFLVMEYLRRLYPGALHVRNAKGMTPLHIACLHGASLDVIYALYRADPSRVAFLSP